MRYIGPILAVLCLGAATTSADVPEQGRLEEFGGSLKNIVTDAGHVYTSPFRMDRSSAMWTAGVFGATWLIYENDQAIWEDIRDRQYDGWRKPVRELGTFLEPIGHQGNTNVYYLGGLGVGYLTGSRWLKTFTLQMLECHLIAGMGKNVVQSFIRRQRPYAADGPDDFGDEKATSFPSGHAGNIFNLAVVLSHNVGNRWATGAIYTGATAVAVQRISSSAHWPSDVFLSSVYGWAVAKAVVRRHEQRRHATGRDTAIQVLPMAGEEGYGLMLTRRF